MAFTGITVDRFGNFRCVECNRFVSASEQAVGRLIKHARHCDSNAQAVAPAEAVAVAVDALAAKVSSGRGAIRQGAISAVLTDDEIVLARRRGLISNDDAMNRDF